MPVNRSFFSQIICGQFGTQGGIRDVGFGRMSKTAEMGRRGYETLLTRRF
jgi:hypothetical protein